MFDLGDLLKRNNRLKRTPGDDCRLDAPDWPQEKNKIDSTIIDLTASKPLPMVDLLPVKPDFLSPDGLRVWRLKQVELNGLRKRLNEASDDHILASPRVTTGDGTKAQIFCGRFIPINGSERT